MRSAASLLALVVFTPLAPGCGAFDSASSPVRPIGNPAPPGGTAPNLAAGLDGELYLSWIEETDSGHALRFSKRVSDDWSAPRTIAEGDDWFVNWADFPSMAALADGTLAAHWLVKSGEATYAYDVVVAISRDGGESWSAPLRPHDDGTETEHGFVSIVPSPKGFFDLVWLDGRFTGSDPRGAMTLRHARLSPDGSIEAPAEIDPRVCDCCATDAALDAGGRLMVAYRDRSESEIRDVSLARLESRGWTAPVSVHDDRWEIAGCPVNGPAIAAADDLVAVAWFTSPAGEGAVHVAFTDDAGKSFDEPIGVDLGAPLGRVDLVALDDGAAMVSWMERAGGTASIRARRVSREGVGEAITIARTDASRSSGFPRMALHGDDLFVTWTDGGGTGAVAAAILRP